MRVLGAALFTFVGMLYLASFTDDLPIAVFLIALPALVLLAHLIFNGGLFRLLRGLPIHATVDEQLKKETADRETLEVNRAISFQDLNTGSQVHFLELDDNSILCLYGQYLFEFEPIDDDPEWNQARLFPTSRFVRTFDTRSQETLEIEPNGDVLDTDILPDATDFDRLYDLNIRLDDGERLKEVSLEEIKAAMASRAGLRK